MKIPQPTKLLASKKILAIALHSILLCALFFIFTIYSTNIKKSLPYIGGYDEPKLSQPAADILKNGDFNPHTFIYPSVPIYLIFGGMTIAYLYDHSKLTYFFPSEIGTYRHPYHSRPEIILVPKLLFLAIAILQIYLASVLGMNISRNKLSLIAITPIALCAPIISYHSWYYLNVDVIASFFAVSSLLYLCLLVDNIDYKPFYTAIVPGILSALAIGSKYNYAVIIVPYLLYYIVILKNRFTDVILLYLFSTIAFFFIFNPYILLDFKTFITNFAGQFYIYARGIPGYNANPGWDQLIYYLTSIKQQFTSPLISLLILGLFFSIVRYPKKTLLLLSFCISYILPFIFQKVHFERNFLPIYIISCIFIYLGGLNLYYITEQALQKNHLKRYSYLFYTGLSLLLLAIIPYSHIKMNIQHHEDTRNILVRWIKSNIKKDIPIYLASGLNIPEKILADNYQVHILHDKNILDTTVFPSNIQRGSLLIVPHYASWNNKAPEKAKAEYLNTVIATAHFSKIVDWQGAPSFIDHPFGVVALDPQITVYFSP